MQLNLKKLFIFPAIIFSLCACSNPVDYIHTMQDYVTSLKIGKPQIIVSTSENKYGYGLLSDQEKILYDQLYASIINYETEVPVSAKSEEMLNKVFTTMMSDYGNLFWVSGYEYRTYSHGDYITGMVVNPEYTLDRQKRDELQGQIDMVCNTWLSEIGDATDYEKSRFVFEKLINEVDYEKDAPDNQNIISVFINKKTVCQGYASAASYMFNKLDIPSYIVTGVANDESHAWNLIMLDGEYYFFDSTWGNSSFRDGELKGKFIDYGYLNITTDELTKTHQIISNIPIPECVAKEDNFFVKEGLYFDTWDSSTVGLVINNAYYSGNQSVSLKFIDESTYNSAKTHLIDEKHFADYCPGLFSMSYLEDESSNSLTLNFR